MPKTLLTADEHRLLIRAFARTCHGTPHEMHYLDHPGDESDMNPHILFTIPTMGDFITLRGVMREDSERGRRVHLGGWTQNPEWGMQKTPGEDADWYLGEHFINMRNKFPEMMEMLKLGHPPKSLWKLYQKTRDEVMSFASPHRIKAVRRKRVRKEEGDEIDIDRVMSADPQHWIQAERRGAVNHIRIGIQMSIICWEHADTFTNCAVAAVALAEKLIHAGYRVEIWLYSSDRDWGNNSHVWIKPGDPKLGRPEHELVCEQRRIAERCWMFPAHLSGQALNESTLITLCSAPVFRVIHFTKSNEICDHWFSRRNPYPHHNGKVCPTSDIMRRMMNLDVIIEPKRHGVMDIKRLTDDVFEQAEGKRGKE